MINVVIFSKDRSCQLDALLRSLQTNMQITHNITVLYNYANEEYKRGYDLVIERFKEITFVKETSFYEDTLKLSLKVNYPCLLWLVDDCIMKNPFTHDKFFERFLNDDSVGIYNLRLTPTTPYMTDFPDDKPRPFPVFGQDNTWEWSKAADEDWRYPMTMDGHMYKTKDMISYLPRIPHFSPPPSFDCTMWQHPLPHRIMICNSQQKILGLVPNRVQTGWPNRHGNVTTKKLNDAWLAGKQIKLESWYKLPEDHGKYHYMAVDFEDRI